MNRPYAYNCPCCDGIMYPDDEILPWLYRCTKCNAFINHGGFGKPDYHHWFETSFGKVTHKVVNYECVISGPKS